LAKLRSWSQCPYLMKTTEVHDRPFGGGGGGGGGGGSIEKLTEFPCLVRLD